VAAAAALVAAFAALAPSQDRTGAVRLQVVPDRADWTYAPGATVIFRVAATRDGHPFALPRVAWKVGPEMQDPTEEKTGPLCRRQHPGREKGSAALVPASG
jgi:hypothetical protein